MNVCMERHTNNWNWYMCHWYINISIHTRIFLLKSSVFFVAFFRDGIRCKTMVSELLLKIHVFMTNGVQQKIRNFWLPKLLSWHSMLHLLCLWYYLVKSFKPHVTAKTTKVIECALVVYLRLIFSEIKVKQFLNEFDWNLLQVLLDKLNVDKSMCLVCIPMFVKNRRMWHENEKVRKIVLIISFFPNIYLKNATCCVHKHIYNCELWRWW